MKRAISSIAIIALSVTFAAGFGAAASAQGQTPSNQNPSNPARDQSATPGRAHGNYSNPHAGTQGPSAAPGATSGSSVPGTGANGGQAGSPAGSSGATARQPSATPGGAQGNYSNPNNTGNSNR